MIAKNIVPSQLPGFSAASSAANANEGAAITAPIVNRSFVFVDYLHQVQNQFDARPALPAIKRPTKHALRSSAARLRPISSSWRSAVLEFLFDMRMRAIQGCPRVGFRRFENLCRLGLSLAPLRFAPRARFAPHRHDALLALFVGGLGLLDQLLGLLAQVLEALFPLGHADPETGRKNIRLNINQKTRKETISVKKVPQFGGMCIFRRLP